MVDKRTKQTRKKQQSISEKPTLAFDMWRFYLLWATVLLCFVVLIARAFYVQVINKDFCKTRPMPIFCVLNVLRQCVGLLVTVMACLWPLVRLL